jgi:hypothetical protein
MQTSVISPELRSAEKSLKEKLSSTQFKRLNWNKAKVYKGFKGINTVYTYVIPSTDNINEFFLYADRPLASTFSWININGMQSNLQWSGTVQIKDSENNLLRSLSIKNNRILPSSILPSSFTKTDPELEEVVVYAFIPKTNTPGAFWNLFFIIE